MYSTQSDLEKIMSLARIIELTNDGDIIGYVNNGAGYAAGQSAIVYDGFDEAPPSTGTFYFAGHPDQLYTISSPTLTGATVSPNLIEAIVDNEAIYLTKAVNASVLRDCIAKADERINTFLRGRYALPFESIPQYIRDKSAELTLCELYLRRFGALEPAMLDRFNSIVADLVKIQKGISTLDTDAETVANDFVKFTTNEDEQVYTAEKLAQYI